MRMSAGAAGVPDAVAVAIAAATSAAPNAAWPTLMLFRYPERTPVSTGRARVALVAGVDGPGPEALYWALLERWDVSDASGFAALFEDEGHTIGFDGSELHGRAEIERGLAEIFADHETATYVAKIRSVRSVADDVTLVRAVVGMVPPGKSELNADVNAIQTLLARRGGGGWRIALLQNTPAQYHARPEAAAALTAELRALLKE
jgi:uncharacterized protein (TIGR02246 family)